MSGGKLGNQRGNGLGGLRITPNRISMPYETIYLQNYWTNVNNFTKVGGPTTTFSNGEMTFSGGGNTFGKRMDLTSYGTTNLMYWRITTIFRPQTLTSATDGFAVGIVADNANNPQTLEAVLIISTGVLGGKIRYFKNGSTTNTSTGALTYSLNDRILFVVERSGWNYTFTATNITPGAENSISLTATVVPSSPSTSLNTSGKFSIWAVLGSQTFEQYKIEAPSIYKNCKTVFVGDSKTEGVGVSTLAQSYTSLCFAESVNKYNVVAKSNNLIGECLNAIHEVFDMNPKYVFLNFGSNDLRFSTTTATWQANYKSYANQLRIKGIKVIHIRPPKETTLDVSTLDSFITSESTFRDDYFVDCNTSFNTSTMLAADGIHPNSTGMSFIASQIKTTVPFTL